MAMTQEYAPLTPAVFYILLALASMDRHGYDIMKTVESDSNGSLTMGPGTLYGSIKRMLGDKLIEESDERPDPSLDDTRRRYYRITPQGRKLLSAEIERMSHALHVMKRLKLRSSQT